MPSLALVASRVRFEEKQLLSELDRRGIPCHQVDTRSFSLEVSPERPQRPGYRVALIREISQTRSYYAARLLEAAGVRTINPSAVIEACGDKLRTSLLLASAGIRTPRTAVALAPDGALAAIRRIGYPVVLKPLSGSWGRLVALARDEETATALLEHRSALPAPQQHVIYIQELIDAAGRDIRVIVVGGGPGAIYRQATTGWRANVALGATTAPCPLTPGLASVCRDAARAVAGADPGGTVLGVDLVEDRSGVLHVLEINHNVEFRGFTEAHQSARVAEVIVAEAERILGWCDVRAVIVGCSGYVGGELLRILLGHPMVTVAQVTSQRLAGRRADSAHPNLRGLTDLAFCRVADVEPCDVLFLATPHRATMTVLPQLAARAGIVIDLSGDFRLDAAAYERYYGIPHAAPGLLGTFTVGCPEIAREQLRVADRVSVPGCMAAAAILALLPLVDTQGAEPEVQVDARTGSSGAGRGEGVAGSHAERHGAMRVFAPVTHRHEAEIARHTGLAVRMSATGTPAVRGVQVVCHARARSRLSEGELRAAFRQRYAAEPFVRVIAERRGIHRLPDPKVLLGSNYCDVGFATDADGTRIAVIAALDNLVKGGAGAAVQCLNIRAGWPERLGLEFPGLHPL